MKKKRRKLRVKEWIDCGEIHPDAKDSDAILADAADAMDHACTHEIIGQPLFKATDGRHYVVEIMAQILPADPQYVRERLAEMQAEREAERAAEPPTRKGEGT